MPSDEEVKAVAEWLRGGAKPDAIIGDAIISGEWTCVSVKDLNRAADRLSPPEKLRLWVYEPTATGNYIRHTGSPGPGYVEYAPIEKVREKIDEALTHLGPGAALRRILEAALKEIE